MVKIVEMVIMVVMAMVTRLSMLIIVTMVETVIMFTINIMVDMVIIIVASGQDRTGQPVHTGQDSTGTHGTDRTNKSGMRDRTDRSDI